MARVSSFDHARLFGPEAARSPDMEAVWSWLIAQDAGLPNWLTLPAGEARALHDTVSGRWNAVLPEVESVESIVVPGPPDVPCQLIVPRHPEPGGILFLHGGGWAFGNLVTHQRFMRLLAIATRRPVLAADYRLAPEHPFPGPFEDALAAWRWLTAAATSHPVLRGPLAIAGDSAGANLAMAVMLESIRRGEAKPDLGLLFYGAFAADLDSPSYKRFATGFGLTRAAMARFWDFYVPSPADRDDARISPINASDDLLVQLPPLYLNAAGLDPLLSETLRMVERLDRVGVKHTFALYEGVHHGFMQMSLRLPAAREAIDEAGSFMRGLVNTPPDRP